MRGLRLLVIVLGVLLLGGTLALVIAIIVRAPHPSESRTDSRAPSRPAPFDTVLDLPAGAIVQSVGEAGTRLAVHLVLQDGSRQIVIVDPGSGARIGTIELRPAR
jgi:hypothetical protein